MLITVSMLRFLPVITRSRMGGGGWGEGAVLPNGLGCWSYSRGLIQALYHVTSETGVQQLGHALS